MGWTIEEARRLKSFLEYIFCRISLYGRDVLWVFKALNQDMRSATRVIIGQADKSYMYNVMLSITFSRNACLIIADIVDTLNRTSGKVSITHRAG